MSSLKEKIINNQEQYRKKAELRKAKKEQDNKLGMYAFNQIKWDKLEEALEKDTEEQLEKLVLDNLEYDIEGTPYISSEYKEFSNEVSVYISPDEISYPDRYKKYELEKAVPKHNEFHNLYNLLDKTDYLTGCRYWDRHTMKNTGSQYFRKTETDEFNEFKSIILFDRRLFDPEIYRVLIERHYKKEFLLNYFKQQGITIKPIELLGEFTYYLKL